MLLQEVLRHGDELEKQLKALAGMKNNNPRNVPGVPYVKWQPGFIPTKNAKTLREKCKQTHCEVTSSWNGNVVAHCAMQVLIIFLHHNSLLSSTSQCCPFAAAATAADYTASCQ